MEIDNVLKTAWIKQLKADWKTANYHYFKDSMRLPSLELSSAEGVLGKWKGSYHRHLSISINLISNYTWEYVQEVIYHEMAHQYVEEVLGICEELPHGEAFKQICLENGIDPTATGDIQSWVEKRKSNSTISSENHKILDKVHKLLALAQSPNEHEAQNAMAKAHEFLLKHNLSLLDVQTKWNYIHKQIGEVGRRNPIKTIISAIITRFFFVEAIWTFGYDQHKDQSGQVLEIYGTHLIAGCNTNTVSEMLETICHILLPDKKPEYKSGDNSQDQIIEHSQALPKGRSFKDALCDLKKDVENVIS